MFILLLFIPVVDSEREMQGWSKPLNMLHIISLPQLLLFITENTKMMLFDCIPVAAIVLLISLVLSRAVYVKTRTDFPPENHVMFSVGSFVGSVCIMYAVSKEIVSVMKDLCIIYNISDWMVGLLVILLFKAI